MTYRMPMALRAAKPAYAEGLTKGLLGCHLLANTLRFN
jgi:hypothetical protein